MALQLSQTPPQGHPRLHVDLHVADADELETEAARLVSLGARRAEWDSYPEDPDFIVLEDPEGNRFCIVDSAMSALSRAPRTSTSSGADTR